MAAERSESQAMWIKGSTLSVGVVLAVALFGMVNYLSLRHYQRLDWTSSKLYTLSEKSRNVLAGLDREVRAVIFLSPQSPLYGPAVELLTSYEAANPQLFKKEIIDPAKNVIKAQQLVDRYDIQRSNVIVIAAGDDKRVIDELDLADYDYSGAQFGQGPTLKAFKGEQLITSAILELIEAKKPKIVLTKGHGELNDALGKAKVLLGRDNFEFEEWSPFESPRVPADADLIVTVRPSTHFLQAELDLFKGYLDGGGRMLFLLDPFNADGLATDPLLESWLAGYGVDVGDDVVFDPSITLFGDASLFPSSYGVHPIVETLEKGEVPVHFSAARSVRKDADAPAEYKVTELVKTSAQGWGETDPNAFPDVAADEGEIHGPVALAVAVSFKVEKDGEKPQEEEKATADTEVAGTEVAETQDAKTADADTEDAETEAAETDDTEAKDEKAPEARLVVFGDVDFAADTLIESAANRDLLLNTFNWLVQREQLIAIEGTRPPETRLSLGPDELSSIYLLVILVMPGLAVVAGVTVFLRRRR